ncbi:concanavalin A-like lectin/glucanase [Thozetella sp. PMI_491]|nr:concanavalin A-like lectin/glucanase [Thozetella sp. PMI_491]
MKPVAVVVALLGPSAALTTPLLRDRASSSRPASHRLLRTLPAASKSHISHVASSVDKSAAESAESTIGGAVLAGSGISSVTGCFAVPTPEMPTSGPTGGNVAGLYGASFWLGIDGVSSCTTASLRAGVDIFWDEGMQTAVAWWQWYPSPATDFANFTVAPGEVVRISAQADGPNAGSVTVQNLGSGASHRGAFAARTATQTFAGQSAALCQSEAAWVIEDFPLVDSPSFPVALVNFTSVTYGGISVQSANGVTSAGATGAQVSNINLQAQGGQLTDCRVGQNGEVQCARVVGGV